MGWPAAHIRPALAQRQEIAKKRHQAPASLAGERASITFFYEHISVWPGSMSVKGARCPDHFYYCIGAATSGADDAPL